MPLAAKVEPSLCDTMIGVKATIGLGGILPLGSTLLIVIIYCIWAKDKLLYPGRAMFA